ncbi:MAG TPA: PQQ-dependent sugar dehydrogenase [Candidatus Limnocylindria bacterium]|jgi:glucose/arabinose dehydrogenase|nr:PQQ-dependent sugar dehydrogenase [Candidatus Limnocylindria bacterium]
MFRLLNVLLLLALAATVRAEDAPAAAAPAEPTLTPLEKAVKAVKLPKGFRYEVLVMGDIPEPVFLQFCPDGRLWFTGRRGDIWAYDFTTKQHEHIAKLNVCWEPTPGRESNERGLHGIAFDPDYLKNGRIYLHYAPWAPTNATAWSNRVSRFTVDQPKRATGLKLDSEQILLTVPSLRGFHQGGALGINPRDGKLYITAGDNNVSSDTEKFWDDTNNPPQVLSALQGKTLRLNLDGSIPKDNPFVGHKDANPAVYTYGHRNPYTLNIDQVTGNVYVGEVGYDRKEDWEEINWLHAGKNYGWPRCMGTNYSTFGGGPCPLPDATEPWITWIHDAGANATCGPIYRPAGKRQDFPAQYQGGMFYADYVRKWIRFATVEPVSNTVLKTEPFARGFTGGPLAMQLGPDGALYFVEYGGWFTGSPNDKVSRIVWE